MSNLNFWEGGNLCNNLCNTYVVGCCENIYYPLPRRRFNVFTDSGFRKESEQLSNLPKDSGPFQILHPKTALHVRGGKKEEKGS